MDSLAKIHPLGALEALNGKYTSEEIALEIIDVPGFITIFSKKGKEVQISKKLDLKLDASVATELDPMSAFPLQYGRWSAVSHDPSKLSFGEDIGAQIDGLGYVSEQSDSRVLFRVSGTCARDLMARGCRLDLHPSVTSKGFCAQTIMAQIGVMVHLKDDAPTFDLYVYSGFARSFWHWLDETAEQFLPEL